MGTVIPMLASGTSIAVPLFLLRKGEFLLFVKLNTEIFSSLDMFWLELLHHLYHLIYHGSYTVMCRS